MIFYNTMPLVRTTTRPSSCRWGGGGADRDHHQRSAVRIQPRACVFTTSQQLADLTTLDIRPCRWSIRTFCHGRNTRTWTGLDNATFTKATTIKFWRVGQPYYDFTTNQFGFFINICAGFSALNTDAFAADDMPGTTAPTKTALVLRQRGGLC